MAQMTADAVADVAHVSRAGLTGRQVLEADELAAEAGGVGPERLGHRPVGLEVEIVGRPPVGLHAAARGQSAGLETGLHAPSQYCEPFGVRRTHIEAAGGACAQSADFFPPLAASNQLR